MKKKVVIVGAGPGGLTAGMLLASRGFDVQIYEKNEQVGGRNAKLVIGDFTFDAGPTFLMMPQVLEEVFTLTGRKLDDYLELKRIDPLYRLRFHDNVDFFPSCDKIKMKEQLQNLFPGDDTGYERYLEKEKIKFERILKALRLSYSSFHNMLHPTLLKALPKLDLGKSLYGKLSDYFSNEDMRFAMTFQSKYLGMSPWDCPAVFTILSYMEHSGGLYHPVGGLNAISTAMAKVVREEGGAIHVNMPVREIIVEKKKACGVLLESGERIESDYVVINADFAHAMTHIVSPKNRKKYTDKALLKRDYSCSTLMIYLGLDKLYDIPHHNVLFSRDYESYVRSITSGVLKPDDLSIYIHNPSLIDTTLAPSGKSALYILVPVPNLPIPEDGSSMHPNIRTIVLKAIKEKSELKDIEEHIEVEKIITPLDWEKDYSVYRGATFNLSHKATQMLYFRPHNRFEEFGNCYLTGGGTHPGSGLPTIYVSGMISADLILKENASSLRGKK